MFQVLIFSFVLQEDESIKYHQLFSLTPIHRLYIRIEPHDDFHDFWWICKMLSFDELDCKILYERVNYCKNFPISNTSRRKICRTTLWDFLDIFYQSNLHTHTSAHKRTRRKSHEKFMIYLGRVSDVSATADDVIRTHFPSIISLTIVLCVCWWFIDKNPITKPEQNRCWCSSPPSFFLRRWPSLRAKQYFFDFFSCISKDAARDAETWSEILCALLPYHFFFVKNRLIFNFIFTFPIRLRFRNSAGAHVRLANIVHFAAKTQAYHEKSKNRRRRRGKQKASQKKTSN